ncbi:NU5M oxidoreductase, partial [Acromyrmex heyeri]
YWRLLLKGLRLPFLCLPLAMDAPTRVSALVHSSTLVTAGAYFNRFLIERNVRVILGFLFIVTIFISGIIANFENDFYKIIALSTLSQLGLIIMILSFRFRLIAYYHLLVHAIFKSILFMAAGVVIHSMKNIQDIRLLGNLNEVMPYVIIRLLREVFKKMMKNDEVKDFVKLFFKKQGTDFLLTVSYSIRLIYYLFFNRRSKFYRYINIKENN